MECINANIESINSILNNKCLSIPDYQRPYKWERRHIRNLFHDLREAVYKNLDEYRIGSMILHKKDDNTLDIVDGQQRLISISLFLYNIDKMNIPYGAKKLLNTNTYIEVSQKNAKENYEEWKTLCNLINSDELQKIYSYIKEKCKIFVITIPRDNLRDAFQLFDSQNNRGKALDPHDLLKAYHLRSINDPKEEMIEKWESFVTNDRLNLSDLFDKHLFRIRHWANGSTGLYKKKHGSELRFSERFIDDFKGVELDSGNYPYLILYKNLKEHSINFPISLTMPIINGETFFKYIEYSHEKFEKGIKGIEIEKAKYYLYKSMNKYQRNRNLYINLLVLYCDRFGEEEIDREICEKIFVWAFYPRVIADLIYDSTIANYAGNGNFRKKMIYQKMFQVLSTCVSPQKFKSNIDTDLLDNYTIDSILEDLNRRN